MHVTIARPAEVVCRVRDARTGEDVQRPMMSWWLESESGMADRHGGGAAKPGIVRLRVVPGRLRLKASGSGYRESDERSLDVAPGETAEAEFGLRALSPLRVTVREDGRPLAEPRATVVLRAISMASGTVERRGTTEGAADWSDLPAGTYSVSLAPLEGYATAEARTVEMQEGQAKAVVFDLVRRR